MIPHDVHALSYLVPPCPCRPAPTAAAKAAGLELKPTKVMMFGNRKLGTPLMQTNRHVAIDLPMKVLVWEDDAGKVWIGYTPPSTLKRHKIEGGYEMLKALTGGSRRFHQCRG